MDELRAEHLRLKSGRNEGDPYQLIHRFGDAQFTEARTTVEDFLRSPVPELRYIALNVLVLHWGLGEHRSTCEGLARTDPDREVRRLAVSGLGSLLHGTMDPKALRLLLAFLKEGEASDVREAAYDAVRGILGVPTYDPAARPLRWPEEFDAQILRQAQELASGPE